MPRKKQSRGDCVFCGREMTKSGLTKHLKTCPQRQKAIESAEINKKSGGERQPLCHLQVRDAYEGDFWLHLEVNGRASLGDLDQYLRAIWLECCGHLSQFSVGGWGGDELSMDLKIERVLTPGVELTHIYDFGTSSETLITATDVREGISLTRHPIYLMARNKIPETVCAECDKPSGWLCMECLIEEEEWTTLCEKHAKTHPHDNYGEPIELVNSPRLGMCGYDGPAEPPY
ncbi:conserved hypothetical protein [Beggiatoa sp. PS]|nr:conserved hypothetical protein [Beggiatoa sp. PS]